MQQSGESGARLSAIIKKAIRDGRLTNKEYDEIRTIADSDMVIDKQEKNLLAQLQEMLSNRTIVRVPDE